MDLLIYNSSQMDDAEIVKSKVDIVEVISSYVPLKKAGRNMSGLCPFHTEKTPSFMVSVERQAFKCFGCGEGGDVFTFLEKVEGWDFRETLEELAKRAGVKLKAFEPTEAGKLKETILSINKAAAKFYSYILLSHKTGESARKYLLGRGIGESIWAKFGLGYSPLSWDKTLSFLGRKGFGGGDIAASGLVVGRAGADHGYYDRFRGRLMFPLIDARGSVVGFSGRVINGEGKEAKYVNSPQTPVFSKGSMLFGFNVTRDEIRDKNESVLVEGEFDLLSLYQAGVKNVVASKGTALTEKQVGILSRACENVAICFDTDLAGDKAARRGIEMLDTAGMIVKVVGLGKYHDPDEFAQKDGAKLKDAIFKASNIYDFLIESAVRRFDANSVEGKKKIGREVLPILAKISDDVVRSHYIGKLAKILDIEATLIMDSAKRGRDLEVEVDKSVVHTAGGQVGKTGLEQYFLALFICGEEVNADFFKILDNVDFEGDMCRALWGKLRVIIGGSKTRVAKKVVGVLPTSFKTFVDELYLMDIGSEFLDREERVQELLKLAARIKKTSLKRQIYNVSTLLKKAERLNDLEQVKVLSVKFNELSKVLKQGVVNA